MANVNKRMSCCTFLVFMDVVTSGTLKALVYCLQAQACVHFNITLTLTCLFASIKLICFYCLYLGIAAAAAAASAAAASAAAAAGASSSCWQWQRKGDMLCFISSLWHKPSEPWGDWVDTGYTCLRMVFCSRSSPAGAYANMTCMHHVPQLDQARAPNQV